MRTENRVENFDKLLYEIFFWRIKTYEGTTSCCCCAFVWELHAGFNGKSKLAVVFILVKSNDAAVFLWCCTNEMQFSHLVCIIFVHSWNQLSNKLNFWARIYCTTTIRQNSNRNEHLFCHGAWEGTLFYGKLLQSNRNERKPRKICSLATYTTFCIN